LAAVTPFASLLSPVRLGPVEARNRVVSTAHQTGLVHEHLPTEAFLAYHEARARGGVGVVFQEATAVHPSGLLTSHTIGGYVPGIVDAYRRLGERVRGHGARLFVQLFHGGREQIAAAPRPPTGAPSAVPTPRFHVEPRALSSAEIGELVQGFETCARRAREGGVDGIELSAAHGYLAAQFLAARSNRRHDAYNGDLDARLRFAREVLEAMRRGAGDGVAVGVRLAADEVSAGGLGPEACAEAASALAASGLVDFVSLALGDSATYAGSVWIAPPPPVPANAIEAPARRLRGGLGGVAVIATTRVLELEDADRIVVSGAADLVGMTRALIADPELVAKGAAGLAEQAIRCVGCNQGCIGHYHAGVPIACLVNPRTGRELELSPPARRSARRVLVVGGGPAGIAAALEAAALGDDVLLAEREPALGGQLRVAGLAPGHAELWRRYERNVTGALARAGVRVELGREVDAAAAEGSDLVVLATGARPHRPSLADAVGPPLIDALDAIRKPRAVVGPALVADWGGGWTGLDAAETLAASGVATQLACAAVHPGETLHQYQRNLYLARLDELGVAIRHHLELCAHEGRLALRHVFSGRIELLGDVGSVVLAQGREPEDELWAALEGRPGVVRAGDVLGPRSAEEAILEGTLVVREA
jgi:2,4-dienoyl-CoA reductase-like NADH-dependent reductase (Old Yellow Enzyme family)